MTNSKMTAALLALAMAAGPAGASPYHVTGLDAADSWEVKLIGTYDDDPFSHETGGAIDITAPLAAGLETSVAMGKARVAQNGRPAFSGWSDTEVAVKWEVLPMAQDGGFAVTTEPALFVPSSSHGVDEHEWRIELPVVLGYRTGPVELRGLIGYARSLESRADEMSYGLVAEYDLTGNLSIGAELAGHTDPGAFVHAAELEADIGFTYALASKVELQGRFGQSLRDDDHAHENHAALYLEVAF